MNIMISIYLQLIHLYEIHLLNDKKLMTIFCFIPIMECTHNICI